MRRPIHGRSAATTIGWGELPAPATSATAPPAWVAMSPLTVPPPRPRRWATNADRPFPCRGAATLAWSVGRGEVLLRAAAPPEPRSRWPHRRPVHDRRHRSGDFVGPSELEHGEPAGRELHRH